MNHIEKRPRTDGVSYRARVKYRGRILSATHRDRARAERWAAEKGAEIRDDVHFAGEACRRRPMAELIDRYIEHVLPQKRDIRNQLRQLRWWRQRIGVVPVGTITRATIATCRDELLKQTSGTGKLRGPATVVRYLAALSHVFSVAISDWEWAEMNPVRGLRKPKEPRGRVRCLDEDERVRLLAACKASTSTDLYSVVILALCTGMRRGEILSLEWRDVDLIRGAVSLRHTKNGSRRGIPLRGPALDALKTRAAARATVTRLVFPGSDLKRPVDISKPWYTTLRHAGIEGFRFHDLRHCAASYLAMNGATMPELGAILGHKSPQSTQRYAHLSVDHLGAVMERTHGRVFGDA